MGKSRREPSLSSGNPAATGKHSMEDSGAARGRPERRTSARRSASPVASVLFSGENIDTVAVKTDNLKKIPKGLTCNPLIRSPGSATAAVGLGLGLSSATALGSQAGGVSSTPTSDGIGMEPPPISVTAPGSQPEACTAQVSGGLGLGAPPCTTSAPGNDQLNSVLVVTSLVPGNVDDSHSGSTVTPGSPSEQTASHLGSSIVATSGQNSKLSTVAGLNTTGPSQLAQGSSTRNGLNPAAVNPIPALPAGSGAVSNCSDSSMHNQVISQQQNGIGVEAPAAQAKLCSHDSSTDVSAAQVKTSTQANLGKTYSGSGHIHALAASQVPVQANSKSNNSKDSAQTGLNSASGTQPGGSETLSNHPPGVTCPTDTAIAIPAGSVFTGRSNTLISPSAKHNSDSRAGDVLPLSTAAHSVNFMALLNQQSEAMAEEAPASPVGRRTPVATQTREKSTSTSPLVDEMVTDQAGDPVEEAVGGEDLVRGSSLQPEAPREGLRPPTSHEVDELSLREMIEQYDIYETSLLRVANGLKKKAKSSARRYSATRTTTQAQVDEINRLKSELARQKELADQQKVLHEQKETDFTKKLEQASTYRKLAEDKLQSLREGMPAIVQAAGERAVKRYKGSSTFEADLSVLTLPIFNAGFKAGVDACKQHWPEVDSSRFGRRYDPDTTRAIEERMERFKRTGSLSPLWTANQKTLCQAEAEEWEKEDREAHDSAVGDDKFDYLFSTA